MDSFGNFLPFLIVAVICFLVFVALREFTCWYLKINERIELQKKTIALLEKIVSNLETGIKKSGSDTEQARPQE
jgi:hypothetical protein